MEANSYSPAHGHREPRRLLFAALLLGALLILAIAAYLLYRQQRRSEGLIAGVAAASAPSTSDSAIPATPASAAASSVPFRRTYNVLLITVDTLRFDLGFMGYPRPITPNIDALAARSTVFERTYATASFTPKSLGPMLIGRYASETIRDFGHYTSFAPANVFLAERVRDSGGRTFAGMCHRYFKMNTGLSEGFAVWDTSAVPPGMADNDPSVTDEVLSDKALALLQRPENTTPSAPAEGDQPRRFFGWFHYFDPHLQYVSHPGAPNFAAIPVDGAPKERAAYDQEIWFSDKQIGRVLDYVDAQPWGKDTAIVLTSDHGEAFGEHGHIGHGRELWEPLVRVPLVVFVPGAKPHRIVAKRSHIDIAPTVLDLMGFSVPADSLRGTALTPDVFAEDGAAVEERDVYMDMPAGPFNQLRRALITGRSPGLKLIHFGWQRYGLFDLESDPNEQKNLVGDERRLREVMDRWNALRATLHEVSETDAAR